MIEKEFGQQKLTCDICFETMEPFNDFQEAVDYKEREGWKSQKVNGAWQDVCPDCQQI